ncbi:RHS repeat-associated core domain-containing protein, partial [Phocaeicola plebeius]|uniref:RHS repeat domain-containing protein n=1 Tax=Phocaeicola plebeius TaxID=310297 RepID=UPI00241D2381
AGGRTNTAKFSLYVSPYLVANQGGRYTKHIYIGSQRIVSKIGDFASYGSDPRRIQYAGSETDGLSVNYKQKYSAQQQVIKDNYAIFEVPYNGTDNNDYVDGQGFCCDDGSPEAAQVRALALENNFQDPDAYEKLQFYYHPDHLGSSSYITNLDGEVVQHIEYVPFGEVFIEERNSIWNTPYLFNAKEFDEETGLYYYGARYYEPRVSLWISTDPMQEKTSNITTYAYCINNPVAYIDHDGKFSKKWMANISRTWYNLWHKQKAGPIIENKDATTSKFKYTYNTYSVNNGEFAITSHYKFDTTASQRVQDIGDGISLAGYATTLSVVGAEVGVPMAAFGRTVSSIGSVSEIVLDVANGDYGNTVKSAIYTGIEFLVEKGLNKIVPGYGKKIGEKGFELGTEILTQGTKLKLSGAERITDKIIEKKQEEAKNDSTICKK